MSQSYDVAIIGLGAMGSAAAYRLAKRGQRVLGLDMYNPPHTMGSTHGESRIIREAYYEHPQYVPLVQRAYECWNELQRDTGETLLHQTGGLMIGHEKGTLVSGSRLSADRHGVDYDMLSAREVRRKYPVMVVPDNQVAILEARAGILIPEACVESHLALASELGAELRFDEAVTQWRPEGGGIELISKNGTYRAGSLVLTPGAWLKTALPDLPIALTVERQVIHWFDAGEDVAAFALGELPIFGWEYRPGSLFYGFPDLGKGVKVALHHQGEVTDVESVDRQVRPEEVGAMQMLLAEFMPRLGGVPIRSEVCMYTNTPDEHFVIDTHPDLSQVLIASACSGHGFKFAPVIGEIIAEKIVDGTSRFDLSSFAIDRLLDSP